MTSINYPPCFKHILENMKETDERNKAAFMLSFLQYLEGTGITEPAAVSKKIATLPLLAQFSSVKREKPLNFFVIHDKTYTIDSQADLDAFRTVLYKNAKSGRSFSDMMTRYDKKLSICRMCPYSNTYSVIYNKEETALCKMALEDFECFKKISGLKLDELLISYTDLSDIFPTVRSSLFFPGLFCMMQVINLNLKSYWDNRFFGRDYSSIKNDFKEQLKSFGITKASCLDDPEYDRKIFSYLSDLLKQSEPEDFDSLLNTLLNRKKHVPPFDIDAVPEIPSAPPQKPSSKEKKVKKEKTVPNNAPVSVQTKLIDQFISSGKDLPEKKDQENPKADDLKKELPSCENIEDKPVKVQNPEGDKIGCEVGYRIEDKSEDEYSADQSDKRDQIVIAPLPALPDHQKTDPDIIIPFDLTTIHVTAATLSDIRIIDTQSAYDRFISTVLKEGLCIMEPLTTDDGTDYILAGCKKLVRLFSFENDYPDMLFHRKEICFVSGRIHAFYDMCKTHDLYMRDMILPLHYALSKERMQMPEATKLLSIIPCETDLCRKVHITGTQDTEMITARRLAYAIGCSLNRSRYCKCNKNKSPIISYDKKTNDIIFTPYDYRDTRFYKEGILLTYTLDPDTIKDTEGKLLIEDILCAMVEKGLFRNLDLALMEIRTNGLTIFASDKCFEYVYTLLSTLFFEKGAVRGMHDLLFHIDMKETL